MGCDQRTYDGITKFRIGVVLQRLGEQGATVTGDNPWDADTHRSGVKLHGSWDEASSVMTVAVADKDFYVPCGKVWDAIEPLIREVQALEEPAAGGNPQTSSGPEASGRTSFSAAGQRFAAVAKLQSATRSLDLLGLASAEPSAAAKAKASSKAQMAKSPSAAATATAAASTPSKTMLYVAGGLAVVGVGWLAFNLYSSRKA